MNFFKSICNMLGIHNSEGKEDSSAENSGTPESCLEKYFQNVDGSEFLDLDKFLEDIQEPNIRKLENDTVETLGVKSGADNVENKSIITINSDVSNPTNDIINISSDEELKNKDMYSLEDEIPLNILVKNKSAIKNEAVKQYGGKNTQIIDIVPCGDVIDDKTFEEYISHIDFKIIDSSLYEEQNLGNVDDDNGYHSSDFEFITESEAKSAGIIKNKKKKNTHRPFSNQNTCHGSENSCKSDNIKNYDYRKNHVVPAGENYLKLFQGHYEPLMTGFMENKAFHVSKMSIDFEGVGFNTRMHFNTERDDSEYLDEANKVALMIPRLYPNENRRKRRRH